jgi:tetratricopeptide (TPR) repeat protein
MKLVSWLAFVIGGASMVATPSLAQEKIQKEASAPAGPALSKEERAALMPLQTAITAKNWAAAVAALPAARAGASSVDARHILGQFLFSWGREAKDRALQSAGLELMIASGKIPAADLPQYYEGLAAIAKAADDKGKLATYYTKLVELKPNDPHTLINFATIRQEARQTNEAVQLISRAITLQKRTGQAAPEIWYKYGLKLAYDGKMGPLAIKLSHDLLAAYPTAENWRDSLIIYREMSNLDNATTVDLQRLMRASQSFSGERDWYDFALRLDQAGLPGEAVAVLDDGSRLKMVDLNKAAFRELRALASRRVPEDKASVAGVEGKAMAAPTGTLALKTADVFLGYGEYDKAISLYRAALQKGSVDANVANIRLGIALALSGNRAEAETVFRAVTGARQELAGFWLLWLARSA